MTFWSAQYSPGSEPKRNYRFQTLEQCQFIAKVEKGQYSEKINQRPWAKYSWSCNMKV